ncbi:MAG TPA: hypothetical protein VNM90_28650 [Haliangium sp.]|nr:hypothetical protein [Haliangium sp.]
MPRLGVLLAPAAPHHALGVEDAFEHPPVLGALVLEQPDHVAAVLESAVIAEALLEQGIVHGPGHAAVVPVAVVAGHRRISMSNPSAVRGRAEPHRRDIDPSDALLRVPQLKDAPHRMFRTSDQSQQAARMPHARTIARRAWRELARTIARRARWQAGAHGGENGAGQRGGA